MYREHEMCDLCFYTNYIGNIIVAVNIYEVILEMRAEMYTCVHIRCLLFLSDFNKIGNC
jgi:hypothetical protein